MTDKGRDRERLKKRDSGTKTESDINEGNGGNVRNTVRKRMTYIESQT